MAAGLVSLAGSSRAPFDTSNPCATRARIVRGFRRGGLYNFARNLSVSAATHQLAKALFHWPIFQRVIRDNQHPPARAQYRRTIAEQRRETLHLAIHRNSQRLKSARRRMRSLAPARSQSPLHDCAQLRGSLNRMPPARLDDQFRDPARRALLTVCIDDAREFFCALLVH